METWREEILAGVDSVEYEGCVPGYIIVYGENSDAILANKSGETLIAAGELGKGRVVVFSHTTFPKGYLKSERPKENEVLLKNIENWVNRRENTVPVNLNEVERFEDIPENACLVWTGDVKDEQFLNDLAAWIQNGGGLVCGTCPWGFAQITGIPIAKMPLNFIMSKLGMNYATVDDYFSTSDRLCVSENCAEFVKLDRAIELVSIGGDVDKVRKPLGNLCSAPHEVCQKVRPALDNLKHDCHCAPAKKKAVGTSKEKLACTLMCNLMIKEALGGESVVADGCEEFPGNFTTPPELQTATVDIVGKQEQYVPTGYYLPAGVELDLSWDAVDNDGCDWSVSIGAHFDELFGVDREWRRWPKLNITEKLETNPFKVCSPFGGLIYIVTPKTKSQLSVTLKNVVPAPRYTYNTAGNWDSESKKPGLWSDISGDLITFTLPSNAIRDLRDPGHAMRSWDDVVRAHMELRGCDPSKGRGQWVVADEQPSAGYMHAGYPIVTHLDVADPCYEDGNYFLMNGDRIHKPHENGFWGLFHELGHMFQHAAWTWEGTGEVTVNIFTLHAMDTQCGLKPWIHPWLAGHMQDVRKYLQSGPNFEEWKSDPGVALAIYAQQARDFGWETFKKVFREYEALPCCEQPKAYEDKIRQWMVRFSLATGRNMCPAFEFWGFPFIDQAVGFVEDLPPYMPSDETTNEIAPDRARTIANKYGISI